MPTFQETFNADLAHRKRMIDIVAEQSAEEIAADEESQCSKTTEQPNSSDSRLSSRIKDAVTRKKQSKPAKKSASKKNAGR